MSQSTAIHLSLRKVFFFTFVIPVFLSIFFYLAVGLQNNRVKEEIFQTIASDAHFSAESRKANIEYLQSVNLVAICQSDAAATSKLRTSLTKKGTCANFSLLSLSFYTSLGVLTLLLATMILSIAWGKKSVQSQANLIRYYRRGWRLCQAVVIITLIVQTPLLVFAISESTVLLSGSYHQKTLIVVAAIGIYAFCRCIKILIIKIPLQFGEDMARAVTRVEATALWQAVENTAKNLGTKAPDNIVIGMQGQFYVTELSVKTQSGLLQGKSLYLSLPLLKHLTKEEVTGIIGHELGHFIGEDTLMSRLFYPFRLKANWTLTELERGGWSVLSAYCLLYFFELKHLLALQDLSRKRELTADNYGVKSSSAKHMASALIKSLVASDALAIRQLTSGMDPEESLLRIAEKNLYTRPNYWTELLQESTAHPLDSHPSLSVRLDALGVPSSPKDLRDLAEDSSGTTAYTAWLENKDSLFRKISEERVSATQQSQSKIAVKTADASNPEGRALLEKYFPPLAWKSSLSWFLFSTGMYGIATVVFVLLTICCPEPTAKAIFGVAAPISAYLLWCTIKNHWSSVLKLDFEGVTYTGMRSKIFFSDISKIATEESNGLTTLTFHFKQPQPYFWRAVILPIRVKREQLALVYIKAKPSVVAEKILRYYYREAE